MQSDERPHHQGKTVKKIISAAALTVLSGLLISGCAGAPSPGPTAVKSAAAMPSPSAAQQASLTAEFKKIHPALDSPRMVGDAVQDCRLILRGIPEAAQIANAKRFLRGAKIAPGAASEEAVKKFVQIIKTNGFCKAA